MNLPMVEPAKKELKSTGTDKNTLSKTGFTEILKASNAKENKTPETFSVVSSNVDAAVIRSAMIAKKGNGAMNAGVPSNTISSIFGSAAVKPASLVKPAVDAKKGLKTQETAASSKKEDVTVKTAAPAVLINDTPSPVLATADTMQQQNILLQQAPVILQQGVFSAQTAQTDGNKKQDIKIEANAKAFGTAGDGDTSFGAEIKGKSKPQQNNQLLPEQQLDELKVEVKNTGAGILRTKEVQPSKQAPPAKQDVTPAAIPVKNQDVEKEPVKNFEITSQSGFAKAAVLNVKQVVSSAAAGNIGDGKEYTVTLKITPPDIGEVVIKTVYTEGKEMNVTLTPATQEAATLLDKNISSIKHDLASIFNGSGTQVNVSVNDFSRDTNSREPVDRGDNAFVQPVNNNRYTINSGVNKIAQEKNTYLV